MSNYLLPETNLPLHLKNIMPTFCDTWSEKTSKNIAGKGENDRNQFLLFKQCFPLYQRQVLQFDIVFTNALGVNKSETLSYADLSTPGLHLSGTLVLEIKKLGTPGNFLEQQCCGALPGTTMLRWCHVTLTEHRCQQLWIRLCYDFKYTHLQNNNNNSKNSLIISICISTKKMHLRHYLIGI